MTDVIASQKFVEVLMAPIPVNQVSQTFVEILWAIPPKFKPQIYRKS